MAQQQDVMTWVGLCDIPSSSAQPFNRSLGERRPVISTPRSSIRVALCTFSCSVLSMPSGVVAQTVIRVEASGIPVAAAEVSIWDIQGRAAFGRTDGAGTLRLALERAVATGAFVLVRRIGYAPARVPFEVRDSLNVAMTAVATTLPVLVVRTNELRCPGTTEFEADSLWRASANRYSMRLTRFRIDWTGYSTSETVSADQRGYADPYEMRPPMYGTAASVRGQSGLEDPPPYAFYERHIALGGEYWQ